MRVEAEPLADLTASTCQGGDNSYSSLKFKRLVIFLWRILYLCLLSPKYELSTMTHSFISQIIGLLDCVRVSSKNSFVWMGKKISTAPGDLVKKLPSQVILAHTEVILSNHLYTHFFNPGLPLRLVDTDTISQSALESRLRIETLSAANSGKGHIDPGWGVLSITEGSYKLVKDGLNIYANQSEIMIDPKGRQVITGDTVAIHTPKECRSMSPGFYLVVGDKSGHLDREQGVLARIYWNISPIGAITLVKEISEELNNKKVIFRFKTLVDPSSYDRADSAVLYLDRTELIRSWANIENIYMRLNNEIRHAVPALTKRLAPGLAFADDPVNGNSFGLDRCTILASALIEIWSKKIRSQTHKLEVIKNKFLSAGSCIDKPYLNVGSADIALTVDHKLWSVLNNNKLPSTPKNCLNLAQKIGDYLCDTAVWEGDACTWLASKENDEHRRGGNTFGSLDHSLYNGTTGIAWFLSEIADCSNNDRMKMLAIGAIRGAAAGAKTMTDSSLYFGWVGVVLATIYAWKYLQDEELRTIAEQLTSQSLYKLDNMKIDGDNLTGLPGTISGLLSINHHLGRTDIKQVTKSLGELLLRYCAEENSRKRRPRCLQLSGISHGASGLVQAFSLLYKATGDDRYFAESCRIANMERKNYSAIYRNWLDRRGIGTKYVGDSKQHYPFYWCHGAPGIAVSRRTSLSEPTDPELNADYLKAIEGTIGSLNEEKSIGCLCHGFSGNLLITNYFTEMSPEFDTPLISIAKDRFSNLANLEVESLIVEKSKETSIRDLGLMTGLAGLGHTLCHISHEAKNNKYSSPLLVGLF